MLPSKQVILCHFLQSIFFVFVTAGAWPGPETIDASFQVLKVPQMPKRAETQANLQPSQLHRRGIHGSDFLAEQGPLRKRGWMMDKIKSSNSHSSPGRDSSGLKPIEDALKREFDVQRRLHAKAPHTHQPASEWPDELRRRVAGRLRWHHDPRYLRLWTQIIKVSVANPMNPRLFDFLVAETLGHAQPYFADPELMRDPTRLRRQVEATGRQVGRIAHLKDPPIRDVAGRAGTAAEMFLASEAEAGRLAPDLTVVLRRAHVQAAEELASAGQHRVPGSSQHETLGSPDRHGASDSGLRSRLFRQD